MIISMIAAYANGRVIGKNGDVPWHLPDDSAYFKRITLDHTIVMGLKTFESIKRPLPRRRNVVLTSKPTFVHEGVKVVHSVDEVLALDEAGELFIVGGAHVYQQFLDVADRLYITEIALDVEGDTYFPLWDRQSFRLVSSQPGVVNEKNTLPHTFFVYERIPSAEQQIH